MYCHYLFVMMTPTNASCHIPETKQCIALRKRGNVGEEVFKLCELVVIEIARNKSYELWYLFDKNPCSNVTQQLVISVLYYSADRQAEKNIMHWEDLNHYLFYDGAKAAIAINYTLLLVSTTVSCKLSAYVELQDQWNGPYFFS